MRSILPLLMLALATPALASDGVLEINQTCAVQTGCFAGDSIGFPVEITTPGSYRLTSNLTLPNEDTDGIVVSTSSISIDLNGFEISGPVTCSGDPLTCTPLGGGTGVDRSSFENRGISVKNGSITGMGAYGVFLGDQAQVTNLRVRWNRITGIFTNNGSTVSGNTVYQNGSAGISGGGGSTVSGNSAYRNGGDGIFVGLGATVSGNAAYENGADGIDGGTGSTISGNTAYLNGANGIDGGTASTVSRNTARRNGDNGILAGTGSTVDGNTVDSNSGDGIEAASGSAVFHNATRSNIGFGLNLLSASTVFRDNVITQNGGTVSGGFSRGAANYCDGVNAPSCP